ncbi:MAG: phage holin family protein [Anaerolineaceae bacterium]|nr:phage holin family protein [Anaerolineaceae bacterium]
MKKLLLRWAINTVALYAAVYLLNGNGLEPQSENWISFIWLALIFGLINAIIKPVLTIAGCPFIILTLGLGMLIINTFLFYLAGIIGNQFGVGFIIDGFLPAFLGALIVSVVSFFFNIIFKDELESRKEKLRKRR